MDQALSNALNYPEHNLSREAAARLDTQRRQQQHELWRKSGAGFPVRCIDMARDNILAERNGHGRALAFLMPSGDAETNLDLLGFYLAKLGANGSLRPCAARFAPVRISWRSTLCIRLYSTGLSLALTHVWRIS